MPRKILLGPLLTVEWRTCGCLLGFLGGFKTDADPQAQRLAGGGAQHRFSLLHPPQGPQVTRSAPGEPQAGCSLWTQRASPGLLHTISSVSPPASGTLQGPCLAPHLSWYQERSGCEVALSQVTNTPFATCFPAAPHLRNALSEPTAPNHTCQLSTRK